jgi:23S rRNA (uracil1939-C5)-methyltransferase
MWWMCSSPKNARTTGKAVPSALFRIQPKEPTPVAAILGCAEAASGSTWTIPSSWLFKEKQVKDALQRIGKVEVGEYLPILGSQEVFNYRNRLDFSFASKRWLTREEVETGTDFGDRPALGFHVPGRWDKVLDVEECHLQPEPSNAIRNRVRELAMQHNITFFDPISQKGYLRNLTLRNTTTGQWMLLLSVNGDRPEWLHTILAPIVAEFPQLTSVMHVVNTKANDTIHDLDIHVYAGNDHIMEEMEGLQFKIGPKSFFQTNGKQAEELYRVARDFAALTGTETVYDLYTGTGTIALYVAKKAKHVVGIEYVEAAIADAKVNAAEWHCPYLVSCGRHEGHLYPRVYCPRRPPRCGYHRPATGRHAWRCGAAIVEVGSAAHCVRELQSGHASPRLAIAFGEV